MSKVLSVLIVEDEPGNRELMDVIVSTAGHRTETCENGAEALDLVIKQGKRYDLILMDVLMPVCDGLEATRQLRANEASRDIPIIIVSAKTSGSDKGQGLAAGADLYLDKPFRRSDLLAVMKAALVKRRLIDPAESVVVPASGGTTTSR